MSEAKDKQKEQLEKIEGERLKKFMEESHLSQVDIIKKVNKPPSSSINSSRMSNYVNGIRSIPNNALDELQETFFLNKEYITGRSEVMFDIPEEILAFIFHFIKEISILTNTHARIKQPQKGNQDTSSIQNEKQDEKYLHITMPKKYYDLLTDPKTWMQNTDEDLSDEGLSIYNALLSKIRKLHKNGDSELEEYVVLPRNVMLDIVANTPPVRKDFQEYIDVMEYLNYPNCQKTFNIKFPKNNTYN